MNSSLNIRLVLPYMKISHHTPYQSRFLKSGVSLATSSVLTQGLGFKIGIGPHRHNHFIRLGLCPYVGHFRQGIGLAHSQHMEPLLKSVRLGLGPSFSRNLGLSETVNTLQDSKPTEVSAEPPISENYIDTNTPLDINGITNGDPILERKLKILILEIDVFRQAGRNVPTPSLIKKESWKELLDTNTKTGRQKLLLFLWRIEKLNLKKKLEKVSRPKHDKEIQGDLCGINDGDDQNEYGHRKYGLNHNTMFLRIYDTTINQHYNNKLIQAIRFGQKIVIDCDYDQYMTSHEAQNLAKQITFAFAENRLDEDPFDMFICNANLCGKTLTRLKTLITTLHEDYFPLTVTSKSYLELFPKEDIVYLTPHCREELTTYNHNSVYVIGGMVDKSNQKPLSLAKAKQEGLKMAKLPLDRYLSWGGGSGKSLTINQMVAIMGKIKTTGDWEKALKYVPRRKLFKS